MVYKEGVKPRLTLVFSTGRARVEVHVGLCHTVGRSQSSKEQIYGVSGFSLLSTTSLLQTKFRRHFLERWPSVSWKCGHL